VGQTFELLCVLVSKELRVRYKGSLLGYLWALANPLAFTFVYYVAFKIIIRNTMSNYGLYLVTGLFPWAWTANALVQSTGAYRHNPTLVRKVKLPRAILPLSYVIQEMVHFLLAAPILAIAVTISTGSSHVNWLWLIPTMALVQLLMLYPITVVLAAINVIVRDVEYLVGIGLQLLFFLTPIVYPPESIPGKYRTYFALNPFASMISAWRAVFYQGRLDLASVGQCLGFALAAGLFAWLVHRTVEPQIGERL
jgi:homopolymeric O-antigen transport system permease protein